jgi:uncharacterized repeat protein (TIGR02543 family)
MVEIPFSTFTPTPCDLNNPHFSTCYATSFSISPAPPPGLDFDTTTGILSGTPISAGTYSNLIISAINSEGSTAFPTFTINISPRIDAFTAARSITTARQYHTATTLQNGKVLVTGGIDVNFSTVLASAALYDPVTDSWSSADFMSVARSDHAANLLKDGRVLVTGGYGTAGLLNSAEIYDPADNRWIEVSPMIFGHSSHTAAMLSNPDGSILVMGGFNPDPDYPDTIVMVEHYNPNTDSWASASQMPEPRTGFTATLLPDGKVLVAGGGNINSTELYDPQNDPSLNSSIDPNSNPWSATAHPMTVNRIFHTATALVGGKVLISGGIDSSTGNEVSNAELYDPALGTWSATGAMSTVRQSHAATLLADGTVLVTGGFWRNSFLSNAYHDFAERYNPTTEVWSIAGLMATPRIFHSAVLLHNGDVLVTGGSSDGISVLASSELYHFFYTVSFSSNGGSVVNSQSLTYNSTAITPITPTKTGYSFAGWYIDVALTSAFAFTTPITANTTLYAKWTINSYSVTPTAGTGSSISPALAQTITSGATTSFTVAPHSGYGILSVTGCNGTLNGSSYTTAAITANCTVSVTAVKRNGNSGSATDPSLADALKAMQAYVGLLTLTPEQHILYDVAPLSSGAVPQGNGVVDVADVIMILRRAVGIGSW